MFEQELVTCLPISTMEFESCVVLMLSVVCLSSGPLSRPPPPLLKTETLMESCQHPLPPTPWLHPPQVVCVCWVSAGTRSPASQTLRCAHMAFCRGQPPATGKKQLAKLFCNTGEQPVIIRSQARARRALHPQSAKLAPRAPHATACTLHGVVVGSHGPRGCKELKQYSKQTST